MKKKYVVTRTEEVTVYARNAEEAELIANDAFQFYGATGSDVQVEELDEFGLTEERGPED